MKKYPYLVFLFLAMACNSNPKNEEQQTDSSAISSKISPPTMPLKNGANKFLANVLGSEGGLLRGVSFGEPIAEVKKAETAQLFEEDSDHLGYTFDTENLETVDILYKNDHTQKITGIELNIYMNSKNTNDSLKSAFENTFTSRYGKPLSRDSTKTIWPLKPTGSVYVKDVSKAKDKGLEVVFLQK